MKSVRSAAKASARPRNLSLHSVPLLEYRRTRWPIFRDQTSIPIQFQLMTLGGGQLRTGRQGSSAEAPMSLADGETWDAHASHSSRRGQLSRVPITVRRNQRPLRRERVIYA